ncbi:3-carboxy-cis,cis-muconate cycloisomerase [Nonomuraea jiangxiensis]|uniref:3-carboxy-cis,cis-muconate cycloisomerase n=1 Tax=Nonomuraea jiangxiensis TaxID=633440 RepID=A0A1G8DBK5_9ACTN|nr:lyase family protein [Nonomuraea jiangxiensis]SDH55092.1 3-carboxy-cis,cis-muconate cycloisomerase [Nonomuraea jiangxiensis]
MSGDGGLLAPVWAGTEAERITSDPAWVRAMLEAEAALARAQARLGLIPGEAAAAIDRAAAALVIDPADLARRSRPSASLVVPLVADLRRAVPGAATYVHRGATSQDIMDSAAMLVATRAVRGIVGELGVIMRDLSELAEQHRDTVMAARTLGQQAVPTTFGLKAAGWLAGLMRARARLRELRLPAQLGGAAGTLAAFTELAATELGIAELSPVQPGTDQPGPDQPGPVQPGTDQPGPDQPTSDQPGGAGPGAAAFGAGARVALELVELFAAEIGLAAPAVPWHAERSAVTDLGAALAGTARALGKPATDLVLMAQTEVGEVAESTTGGSSAMPQKRNPALSVLVRSAALQVPAYTQLLGQVGEHERAAGAWQAEWLPLREALRLTGGAAETAAELVAGLRVFPERMRANAGLTGGRLVAERLAARLGREALAEALAAEVPLRDALAEAPAAEVPLREALAPATEGPVLDELLDPEGYLGAAPELVDRILATYREQP